MAIGRTIAILCCGLGFSSWAAADPLPAPVWDLFSNNRQPQAVRAAGDAAPRTPPQQVDAPKAVPAAPKEAPQIAAKTAVKTAPVALDAVPDDLVIRNMIGQMIMIGFPSSARDESWQPRIGRLVRDGKIGGIILFSENVINPRQVKQLTDSVQVREGPQPFICVDQEGGAIQRLTANKGFIGTPGAQQIAAMAQAQAFQYYQRAAQEMAHLGINCNFGPVLDLNVNPDSPIIGGLGRSYSAEPRKVVTYARSFIDAHRQAGILTAAKHFPGHGSAKEDSHEQVVNVSRTWKEIELEPFQAIVKDDPTDMVMIGHLVHPRFSDGDRPSSLSQHTIKDILRDQLDYRGLVVTDDLDMGAIRKRYGVEQAAVMAIEAGNDIVIVANTKVPDPFIADRVADAVFRAVAEGRISRTAIEESYSRILAAKRKLAERRNYVLQSGARLQ
ncbi:beta-glucosidase-like glycosyl hydrolase [Bradyrhizobium sp. YR681]|uniref:glycoside hydrolase family 3 protein n=1 Tax=Bradyrhizobium sp. YR681 TaxID=1144344 RepID=UPI000270EED2|nr:glycoside hydrolase family 3 N-terminal domain-containing protein [Bradyrhizobium sp. YR681]EJN13176.1 beta-glucosidase-like glycosyl hydrolase [Bradyrhizobium sp. YR681]